MAADTFSLDDVRQMAATPEAYTLADVQKMAPTFSQRMLARETSDLSSNLRRGAKDVIDTGAEGLAWAWDKVTGTDPANGEYARVRAMNQAGRDQWVQQNADEILPHIQRLAGNALATAPVTGALGAGAVAAGLPRLGAAIGSGGMTVGPGLSLPANVATRAAGGAINGYVSAGLVDPDSAPTGAAIGAVAPPALQAVGAAGRAIKSAYTGRGDVGLARDITRLADVDPSDSAAVGQLRDALRQQGPSLIPGAEPTVPQILQTPGLSQLQRSVKAANPGALGVREGDQGVARMEALNRIAPVGGTVQQAAEEAGNSIAGYALPARQAQTQRVSRLFDAVDPNGDARFMLPVDRMKAAQDKYLGAGTFGSGGAAQSAIGTAEALSANAAGAARPVTFDEVQNLRSSLNENWKRARMSGNAREAAALQQMIRDVDSGVQAVSQGHGQPGEVFPQDMVQRWREALDAHAAKKQQFDTGPQASMFRMGGDGQPQIQGAEIPSKFFSGSRSQVENAQSFRRLVQDDPQLLGDLRRYAMTDAAGQVDRFGNLTNAKFNRWLDARSGATGVIFNDQQRATLKAVGDDLRRADTAESLGRSSGSDTAQKTANMLRLGFLDNPLAGILASHVPGGQAALELMRRPLMVNKAERFAGLLADPERVAGLLELHLDRQAPVAGGLLGMSLDPAMHRFAPLLYSQGGTGGN
jgi:hypothetical protein